MTDNNAPADDVVARLKAVDSLHVDYEPGHREESSERISRWLADNYALRLKAAAEIERLRAKLEETNVIGRAPFTGSRVEKDMCRICELEDGLRPFAEHADLIGPSVKDDAVVAIFNSHEITVADLRRARALIERNSK